MTPSTQPVAVSPLGPATAATVAWRLRGQLHVTVVVKATFALVPEGRMSLVAPEPIALDEQPDPSGRGLRTAGDLAPYRGQCDVVVTGHAELPPGLSSPEVMVRLTVVQGGQVCIDKQAQLDGSARVGVARSHVRIDGMGPLSRSSPLRSRLLRGIDARRLLGLRLDIPEGLDGSYFQAAPADQRLGALRGDEWIVLGGMFAQRPKLRTQLPEARGAARLYRRQRVAPRTGEPIPLRADTVHVDVDRRCCSVVWRGHAPVDEAELASLRVLAGVETPAVPLAWGDPFANEIVASARPASSGPASQRGVEGGPLSGTNPLSAEEVARVLAAAATPFDARHPQADLARSVPAMPAVAAASRRLDLLAPGSGDGSPRAETALVVEVSPLEETVLFAEANPLEANPLQGTNPISPEEVARLFASAVTPFDARRAPAAPAPPATAATSLPSAAPRPAPAAPVQHGGDDNPLLETNPISPAEAARLLASAVTPFEARRAPAEPERSPAAAATAAMAATRLPAMPLAAVAPRLAPAAPVQHGGDDNPLLATNPISPEEAARLFASAATPFEARRAPAEPARSAAPAILLPAAASRGSTPAPVRHGGGNALEGTNPISLEEAARLRVSVATPFEARRAPVSARVEPSASPGSLVAPSYPPPPSHEARVAPPSLASSPSTAAQPIVAPPSLDATSALPQRLGAQFLAAMADVELLAD
ncbi:DUF2169 domain-containing protein [Sorangium sp. So ce1024]|uniref:DUF2169 domain-containing protein n=1 Tax=Sorangium sp. So ce1024 TaxID=3133327 RepID=UPI003F1223AB